ncbi:hypothetical protein MNEG_2947 [Monoraphidium neglectum]|uniref:Pheophorbide a oxygenase domain-containing protein n=1 Tax=Monoraphidium neglectum TaxID=145388 RepID=A0A0D2NJF3_9CHLO|nr:hypothetical protein MNEG_2947 [Monoraphidium neglectum]KIZ05011.1 hypothetical protein MNEG_2947 [Monoraphidium neglectum]|eukprot:XP_013904030.1 hypothetical protein MNEG_2947 [Monoraphidium neglectum]
MRARARAAGWDVLLENLADPSHLPFSHNGLAGLRREKAVPMPFTSISLPNDGDGAGTGAAGGEERPPNVFNHGRPVGLFRYPTVSGEGSLALVAVNAPCSVSYFSRLSSITISSEDLTLRKLGGGRAWAKSYYMPVTCDRMIVALRAWIDKVGGPKWDDRADPPAQRLTRRQINDRWGQHSRECTACQAAVANLRRQAAAFAGAAAALVAALAGAAASAGLPRLLSGGAPAALGAGALAGAAIAAAAALRAWRMLAQFEYVEYFAADNN